MLSNCRSWTVGFPSICAECGKPAAQLRRESPRSRLENATGVGGLLVDVLQIVPSSTSCSTLGMRTPPRDFDDLSDRSVAGGSHRCEHTCLSVRGQGTGGYEQFQAKLDATACSWSPRNRMYEVGMLDSAEMEAGELVPPSGLWYNEWTP